MVLKKKWKSLNKYKDLSTLKEQEQILRGNINGKDIHNNRNQFVAHHFVGVYWVA